MSAAVRAALAAVLMVLAAVFTAPAARAEDANAAEAQGIISAQIDAFRHDDGNKAYSFASPTIQMLFPSTDAFMNMVRGRYAPVYHPQQFQFGSFTLNGDKLIQTVDITADDGTLWTAEYTLGRQPDGSLKIEACRLEKRPGIGA